eukprot:1084579_1
MGTQRATPAKFRYVLILVLVTIITCIMFNAHVSSISHHIVIDAKNVIDTHTRAINAFKDYHSNIRYNCSLRIMHNRKGNQVGPTASFHNGLVRHFLRDRFASINLERNQIRVSSEQEVVILINNRVMLSILSGPEHCDGVRDFKHHIHKSSVPIAYTYHDSKRTPYMRNKSIPLVHLPLFFRVDFGDFGSEIWPSILNTTSAGFNVSRPYIVSIIMCVGTGNRKQLEWLWDATQLIYGDKAYVYTFDGWKGSNNEESKYLNTEQYRNVLFGSKFVVCAAGNNPQTYRFWESLSCGAIPIIALWETKHGFVWEKRYCNGSYDAVLDIGVYKTQCFSRNNLSNFYWHRFDKEMLLQTIVHKTFRPFIVLEDWLDLITFLSIASLPQHEQFWRTFQEFTLLWFREFMQQKMTTLTQSIVAHSQSQCIPTTSNTTREQFLAKLRHALNKMEKTVNL